MAELIITVSRNIRRARLAKHLTQVEVASKAGVSTNHYAKIERGEVMPTLTTLESLAKCLHVKSSDILPF